MKELTNFKKINTIIEELELDFIEFISSDIKVKRAKLPLVERKQIKALIYNLLTSEKYRKKISYKDYSEIIEVLFNRLK